MPAYLENDGRKDVSLFEGIVLAAGRSQRAGTFKPAHVHEGQPLVAHAIASLWPWCRRVIVVTGYRHELIAALIAEQIASRPQLTLAVNQAFDDGMFSSVQTGVRLLDEQCTGFFVLPADCPLIGTAVPGEMVRTFLAHDGRRAVVPEHRGRGGHPVLLPGAARALILAAAAPATLREVVKRLDPVRLPVAQAAVLMDLDTRSDLAALTADAAPAEGP